MKAFYKIENGKLNTGSGVEIPDGFTEYTVGQEPQELLEALEAERVATEAQAVKNEALAYLASTDWYVVRYADTGEVIPEEIKVKRAEARLKI